MDGLTEDGKCQWCGVQFYTLDALTAHQYAVHLDKIEAALKDAAATGIGITRIAPHDFLDVPVFDKPVIEVSQDWYDNHVKALASVTAERDRLTRERDANIQARNDFCAAWQKAEAEIDRLARENAELRSENSRIAKQVIGETFHAIDVKQIEDLQVDLAAARADIERLRAALLDFAKVLDDTRPSPAQLAVSPEYNKGMVAGLEWAAKVARQHAGEGNGG